MQIRQGLFGACGGRGCKLELGRSRAEGFQGPRKGEAPGAREMSLTRSGFWALLPSDDGVPTRHGSAKGPWVRWVCSCPWSAQERGGAGGPTSARWACPRIHGGQGRGAGACPSHPAWPYWPAAGTRWGGPVVRRAQGSVQRSSAKRVDPARAREDGRRSGAIRRGAAVTVGRRVVEDPWTTGALFWSPDRVGGSGRAACPSDW